MGVKDEEALSSLLGRRILQEDLDKPLPEDQGVILAMGVLSYSHGGSGIRTGSNKGRAPKIGGHPPFYALVISNVMKCGVMVGTFL